MDKASRIVFLIVTFFVISCGVVLGQKCDCQDECKESRVPHCIGGVCKCLPPKADSTNHEGVMLGQTCLRDGDCPSCTEGIPICSKNGLCGCLPSKTYFTNRKENDHPSYHNVLNECRSLILEAHATHPAKIYREQNAVVDALAKEGTKLQATESPKLLRQTPPFVTTTLQTDSSGGLPSVESSNHLLSYRAEM
ncbi:hypothetical protein FXO38_32552 [Capsicum annuum]|nr:hypothetical protein FXO38_32552 [Capsicum annuum]